MKPLLKVALDAFKAIEVTNWTPRTCVGRFCCFCVGKCDLGFCTQIKLLC